MKIAILYICTGRYAVFWDDFFRSCELRFLPKVEKEYFVFTDSKSLYAQDSCPRIHKIHQENLGWPHNTLMRFEMFAKIEQKLRSGGAYIFFFNANTAFLEEIDESFLPQNEGLLFVAHPCMDRFLGVREENFTYERNPKSLAYIPKGAGSYYVCGGVNGGKTEAYLELIRTCRENIAKDLANGIIALWHDESHINRYILDKLAGKDFKLLSASYAYPQNFDSSLPFGAKILMRDKNLYGGHSFMRGIEKNMLESSQSIKNKIKKIIKKLFKEIK